MTIATNWCITFFLTIKLKAEFGDTGSENIAPPTAMRTNAKFLIACGIQLFTLFLMLTRALINNTFVALSVCTAHFHKCSNSAQSKQNTTYATS